MNRIGDEGCMHLLKSNWPKLKNIDLGSNFLIKEITTLERKAANIYQKISGANSK